VIVLLRHSFLNYDGFSLLLHGIVVTLEHHMLSQF
jgi:hypothetical protein